MSINTADFLCRCIVHVLSIIIISFIFFVREVRCLSCEPEVVSPDSGRTFLLFMEEEEEKNILKTK